MAMKWVLVVGGVLAGLALLVLTVGSLLPRQHQATSRIVVSGPIDRVWTAVRDVPSQPTYWSDMKSVERLPDRDGKETWRQTMKNGFDMPIIITEESPPPVSSRPSTARPAPPSADGGSTSSNRCPVGPKCQ